MSEKTPTVRKNIRDLSNPLELRELNRQMEWIWRKILGGLDERAFSDDGIRQVTTTVEKIVATEMTADAIDTNFLNAAIAKMMVAVIGVCDADYLTAVDANVENLIVRRGLGNSFTFDNLKIVYAQIVSATIGELCVKASDGNYYTLDVDSEGKVTASIATVTDGEISAGHTNAGKVILGTDIVAEELSTSDLFATFALVDKIDASRINVDTLVARAAFAEKLFATEAFIHLLRTEKIVGEKSIEIIAGELEQNTMDIANQAQDFASTVTRIDADMESLQGQIDGSITTWFYEVAPTNENEPAVNWTSTDEKNLHLGDLYYDTVTGYCYRWQVQNNAYSWQRITDTDVTKALSDAASAQDTADAKRRVFVSTPVPPYDMGDLWVQGDGGDILRCNAQKISGQSYAAGDWVKASKYTDDTTANQALTLAGGSVASTDVEFYLSTSATTLSGGSWQTVAPEWVDGKYMWMRVKTALKDGTERTSDPTCIAGATGATGPQGVSITAVTEEYYLSTSKTSPTGGSWQSTQPAWMMGTYVWTRVKISYNNGNVSYTEPYCDTSWEVVNDVSIYTSAEPPKAPIPDGKLWVDTAQDPNVIRRWLGQDVSTERDYTASASGNPVETPPGMASFDSIQSVLLPVQAGSGDPSPDNIRPISGRTDATLTRCGVNIFPPGEEKTGTMNGITFVSDGNGKYTLNGTSTGSAAFVINLVKPVRIPDAYVGYFHMLNSVANGNFAVAFFENGTSITFSSATIINRIRSIDGEFGSLLRGRTIDAVQLYVNGSGRVFDNFTLAPMLLQTGTLTDYKPYTGDTYTADFGQMVYGGTMDWTTGVLTVTHKYLEFKGTENWIMESSGIWAGNNGNTFGIWFNGAELGISNDLITASSTYIPVRRNATGDWRDNCVAIAGGGASVNFIRTSYASVDGWKAYLADQYAAGTPVQIVYKLATPTTIQLSPVTVTALKGVNTLHTDADSVSVAYTASGWEIVNDLSEINDVSNRLLAQQAAAQQAIDQLATAITVDSDGAHFYKPGYRAQNEVRIDQNSVDILVGGSVNSSFVAGGLILGNYMLWHPEAAGGLAFNLI